MNNTRKYPASVGEPESFDFDGTLQDRKLTPETARAMLRALADVVPAIEERGKVEVRFGYNKRVMCRGSFCESRVRKRITGEIVMESRRVNLHVHRDGATEKTMLHELAHACADQWARHGPRFGEWCLKLEEVWLDLLTSTKVPGFSVAPKSYSIAADTEAK